MQRDEISFSIVTVTRNAAQHLPRCLDSVTAQTYANREHIVVDGNSTDGTQAIVRTRGDVAAFVSEPDDGIYHAMNKGLGLTKGSYVLFLGADDYFVDPSVLTDVAHQLRALNEPDFVYGAIEVRTPAGGVSVFRPPGPEQALDLMICGCLPHQASFAHRRVFERIGSFDTRYKIQADYDWFLRVLAATDLRIRRIDRVVASFALGGASSRLRQGQEETYAIQNAFPLYREPAWMEKRLRAFQVQLLEHRLRLQDLEARGGAGLLRRVVRKALGWFS